MFEQNRCMGKKVSIFNGVGFGTKPTTQTRSAAVAALQTYSTEYSFPAYVCITCGRQTIFSTSTFSQEDTPNYVVNKEFSVLGWLLTSYI